MLSFGSCKKLKVVIAGLLSGSCKKLEVVIAGPLFVKRNVLLGVFGLQGACTPKMNALQLVIVTRWCLEVIGSDKL